MLPIFLPTPTTTDRVYTGRSVQIVAEVAPQPLGTRSGQADRFAKGRILCNPSAPHNAQVGGWPVISQPATPFMTSRLRRSPSGTVSSSTPETCWHRQPSLLVCRTRRGKGCVENIDIHSADMVSTLPARIAPQSRGQEDVASIAIVTESARAVRESNRSRPEPAGGWPAMGQARLVTTRALDVFRDTRKEIVDATNAGDIAPFWAARIYGQLVRLEDEMTFADNRAHVASLALRDVKDVRNIEERCARAWMNPIVFDLGPEAA